jgi:hypothetical protein
MAVKSDVWVSTFGAAFAQLSLDRSNELSRVGRMAEASKLADEAHQLVHGEQPDEGDECACPPRTTPERPGANPLQNVEGDRCEDCRLDGGPGCPWSARSREKRSDRRPQPLRGDAMKCKDCQHWLMLTRWNWWGECTQQAVAIQAGGQPVFLRTREAFGCGMFEPADPDESEVDHG